MPSLLGINKPGLGIAFTVVVNSLTLDELTKLSGQLITSDLSISLIVKQLFGGEKRNSGNYFLKIITFSIFSSVSGKFIVGISIFSSEFLYLVGRF